VVLLAVWGFGVFAAHAQVSYEAGVIAKAKQEGEVVFYASMNLNDAEALKAKFQEKYPFIRVELNRRGREILTVLLTEAKTGRHVADVIQTNVFGMYTIKKDGLFASYTSPEDSYYPGRFKDRGYWTTFNVNPYAVTINTKMVAREDFPKTYQDLLKPLWKGKIMLDSENAPWFGTMLQIMGRDKGLEYMKALSRQNVQLRSESSAMVAQLIASGEAALHVNIASGAVDQLKKRGAPIDWIALGPVPVTPSAVGVAVGAPHPNAARLFVDFMLSKDAQRLILSLGRAVVRSDVLEEQTATTKKSIDMIPPNADVIEKLDQYAKEFREIFSK